MRDVGRATRVYKHDAPTDFLYFQPDGDIDRIRATLHITQDIHRTAQHTSYEILKGQKALFKAFSRLHKRLVRSQNYHTADIQ
jgi:hypothetical protein